MRVNSTDQQIDSLSLNLDDDYEAFSINQTLNAIVHVTTRSMTLLAYWWPRTMEISGNLWKPVDWIKTNK